MPQTQVEQAAAAGQVLLVEAVMLGHAAAALAAALELLLARAKAEEVLKELYGPVYWRPGRSDDSWSPTILGMSKRDLARDVLVVFGSSSILFRSRFFTDRWIAFQLGARLCTSSRRTIKIC